MRVGITTTLRRPGPALDTFLRYHRQIDVSRFILFFHEPNDPDLPRAAGQRDVLVVPCDDEHRRRQASSHRMYAQFGHYLQAPGPWDNQKNIAQQILNTESALELAGDLGLDWLLHIDIDEVFLPYGLSLADIFARHTAKGHQSVVFANHEAVPEALEYASEDYFREMTLFKRSPRTFDRTLEERFRQSWPSGKLHFLAYENGKAAVRVGSGALPAGCHRFTSAEGYLPSGVSSLGAILHYPYSSFERYWTKHTLKRAPPSVERLFGAPWRPPLLVTRSEEFAVRQDREGARAFYAAAAVLSDQATVEQLEGLGLLLRLDAVATAAGTGRPPAGACPTEP